MNAYGYPKPQYGKRLLVNIVDEYAAYEPERIFVYQPYSSNLEDGYRPITFRETSRAVNHLAVELLQQTQDAAYEKDSFPTVAYIGPSDIRYAIVMLACIKAHRQALFISPRNSLEAQLSLFKRTQCAQILYESSMQSTVEPWLQFYPMPAKAVPPLEVWLQSTASHVPYNVSFEEARWHPLAVLHTSGSTGIPKPVTVRQGSAAIVDDLREVYMDGSPVLWSYLPSHCSKIFAPMPSFHMAGVACMSFFGIYFGTKIFLGVPNRPLNADIVAECLKITHCDAAVLPPSIIEDMSTNEEHVRLLANLKLTGFGGGNLSPSVGDELVRKADDDVYEMFIVRKDPKEAMRQPLFYTFPDKTEWSTGDMYKKHPTKPNHWQYYGRTDNVIVFSTGEKLNPVTIEAAVVGHPAIRGALVVGQQRLQPALILEPHEFPKDETAAKSLIEGVWPIVADVNKVTVAHGRIVRDMVVLADPKMPFSISGKGSIQRMATVTTYKDFIDGLYAQQDEGIDMGDAISLDTTSPEAMAQSILDIVRSQIHKPVVNIEADLFSTGMDSMEVITLSKILRSTLETAGVKVVKDTAAPRIIYANSTIKGLAEHLYSSAITGSSDEDAEAKEIGALAKLISKYTKDLPSPNTNQPNPLDEHQTIVITGTTGSLGAYMLDLLIKNPRVAKILAFNRGQDGGSYRQPAYNAYRGLSTDFSKVEFLAVDLSKPYFGLHLEKYNDILATTDRIIHNAWPVNFNISVSSFEPYIFGVRQLVNFSNKAAKRVPIIYISSIGTVGGWVRPEPIPERRLEDLTLPAMGYGRSKFAASSILDAAVEQSGILAAVIRVGQIAGARAKKGVWNPQEFIPSLIASSVHLGVLPSRPSSTDVVDWTPVEDIAGLVLDVAGITEKIDPSTISGYFHGVNPSVTSWTKIAAVLKSHYCGRIKDIVPLNEWIQILEASSINATAEDVNKNPAIKLIDAYKGIASGGGYSKWDMERTIAHSPTMRNLGPVDEALMRNWCDQWNY
ncbi:putative NRPS-like protein biosynthetic cluster [Trichoderma asperellum]|uniref:putative NRPS-like protein biosynthetic cluster n=1 Tax=Trichoderma asperellum TaxID=101201 RepID=UPI00331F0C1C|nr:putative NRPS-like protein biosynthetic cluster [Trichoderma asperellum]